MNKKFLNFNNKLNFKVICVYRGFKIIYAVIFLTGF